MRVGLDYRPALLLRSGIGRYVRDLVRALPDVDAETAYRLFGVFWHRRADIEAEAPRLGARVSLDASRFPGRALDLLGAFTPLSVISWTGPVDVFHFTDYVRPPLPSSVPAVMTLFDTSYLSPEPFHPPANAARLAAVAERLVRRSRVVIAISEATRAAAIEHYGLSGDRVVVAPLGVDERFHAIRPAPASGPPIVLAVGTIEPRKNHVRLLHAVERLLAAGHDFRLVLAGRRGWMYDDVFRLLARPALAAAVEFLEEVSELRLLELFSRATVLAYPSLHEGFGLPVLEGMAAGVPVLTSDRGATREVAGDAARLVDPESEDDIAHGLAELLEDGALRARLARRGRDRAREFTWHRCAERTVAAYRRALEGDG